jgi:hypothetical protein
LPLISILKLIYNPEHGEILLYVPTGYSIFIPVLKIFLSERLMIFLKQENKSNPAERAVALTGSLDPLFTFITFNFSIPNKD